MLKRILFIQHSADKPKVLSNIIGQNSTQLIVEHQRVEEVYLRKIN